jgi:4-methylaminobutanoate oxidase (formaldehyde-forming)
MLLNGPESFTPDGLFLLGEAPELRGFFLGCGMNSVGAATGGGAGRAIAEWIVEGRPTMDLWPVDIRRFAPFQNNLRALAARIPEELGLHYAIAYPGREPNTARNLRQSPLHDRLQARGARFGMRAGWERPSYFVPPGESVSEALSASPPSTGRRARPPRSSTSRASASCWSRGATRSGCCSGFAPTTWPCRRARRSTPRC